MVAYLDSSVVLRHLCFDFIGARVQIHGMRLRYPVVPFLVLILTVLLFSCQPDVSGTIVSAPASIRESAFTEARRYLGMPYEWGGQEFPRGIDCSGLLVNVYRTATNNTEYELLFDDATAYGMHASFVEAVTFPSQGDLLFMGDGTITHVAIIDRIEGGVVFFIDAYSAAEDNGQVVARSYPVDSPKIISFGRMLLRRLHQ
jgi:hypothetical protein